jgi:phage replication O-like protein O
MANPQRENGYTAIANEIMEALARYRIPGEKRQVLDYLLRMTYGFNRKQVEISYGEIAEATGIHRQNVKRALDWLYSKRITGVIKTDYRAKKVYEFNKNYEDWVPFEKKKGVIKSDYKSVIKTDAEDKVAPFIVKTKKKSKNFDLFWKNYPIKKNKKKAREIWCRLKKKNELPDIDKVLKAIKDQIAEKQNLQDNGKFCPEWKHPTTWLNNGCWDDETDTQDLIEQDNFYKELA